jgi:hypothetical protein
MEGHRSMSVLVPWPVAFGILSAMLLIAGCLIGAAMMRDIRKLDAEDTAAHRIRQHRHSVFAADFAFLADCRWCADEEGAAAGDCTCDEPCEYVSYCMRRAEVTG